MRRACSRKPAYLRPKSQFTPSVLALEERDSRLFGFCYDSAHDQIGGPRPLWLLNQLGDRLRAVHLSDRIREFVDHVPPGDGFIDWDALSAAIHATPFAGPLLFEVLITHTPETTIWPVLQRVHARGSALYDQIFASRSP